MKRQCSIKPDKGAYGTFLYAKGADANNLRRSV